MRRLPRVYVSFDSSRSKNPASTDLKYYFLLRAWLRRGPLAGSFIDVHGRARAGRPADLRAALDQRLRQSDVLLVILTGRTPASEGWLSWEIEHGVSVLGLPVLCAYPGHETVDPIVGYPECWPLALQRVARARAVPVSHVPFRPQSLAGAMRMGWSGDANTSRCRCGCSRDAAGSSAPAFGGADAARMLLRAEHQ